MGILVVGSVAYDDIQTPEEKQNNVLGGAATHFSVAASFFSSVSVVGVVGDDFAKEHIAFLESKNIDTSGIEIVKGGKTFRWAGRYLEDMNNRETIDTQLGVFASFNPKLHEKHRTMEYVFLANIHPGLQLSVLGQVEKPRLVAMDTMNLWINTEREDLLRVIERVDMIFINDEEAKLLTGNSNVLKAARKIMEWGPRIIVIKRGEFGALLFKGNDVFSAPALPLSQVKDPTGAGDTFAGGFMGYVAKTDDLSDTSLRRAVIVGSVMASYQVEDFGLDRLRTLTEGEINERFARFKNLAHFDHDPLF
jgi:sugar/nucleoside kinase (ribokinase family)